MNALFGCIFLILLIAITYPLAKNFQLCGYDIKYFFKHFFVFSFCFSGKNRLIFTKRMIRLMVLYIVLLTIVTLPYFIFLTNFWWIAFCVMIEIVFLPLLFMFAALVIQPIENAIKVSYLKATKKKLTAFDGKKIAITGSFGKTTTKNFLVEILRCKYKVCATPKNYNTPMGLCKTVREVLKDDDEIFVVEMGARHKGDIAELMELLQPSYGVMTAIGQQHLETFGDLQTIISTKYEMCEHMCNGGVIVFDCGNENTKSCYEKYSGEKIAANLDGGVKIEAVKYTSSGCECEILIRDKKHKVTLSLIGSEILKDLACAISLALQFGVEEELILARLPFLKTAPHRLELIKGDYCTIIDDSYNSNLTGAMQACECVQLCKGKRIIVSPGLVEQGEKQYELNFKLGKVVGASCDDFIIMNEINKVALQEGAKSAGMNAEHMYFATNRKQQYEILKKIQERGSVVLFENDLPDNFK